MKDEEAYLKAYASVLEPPRGARRLVPVLQWATGPIRLGAIGTRAVFQCEQGVLEGHSNGTKCSPAEPSNHWQESRDHHLATCLNKRHQRQMLGKLARTQLWCDDGYWDWWMFPTFPNMGPIVATL